MSTSVTASICALQEKPVHELKKKYREVFDGEEPRSSNRMFLIRRISFRIQEVEYGGLGAEPRARLEELKSEINPLGKILDRAHKKTRARFNGRDPRLPPPGATLRRVYKDRVIEVGVRQKGFEYDGRLFVSLTAVAREVTGAHWNGFLFFNL